MKWLIAVLMILGLIALGGYYLVKRARMFLARLIDPRSFAQNMKKPSGMQRPLNNREQEIYNKDGVRVMKGEAKRR